MHDQHVKSTNKQDSQRTISFWGATGIGVGAIVGGGILALAGVAFAATGPGAMLAFALNGLLALLTAASFSELSTRFPQSGGTYTFARKVLSVEAAFAVGWVVWFASIAAGALYALGFGYFAVTALQQFPEATTCFLPVWLAGGTLVRFLAILATVWYTQRLLRQAGGASGNLENIGKLIVFGLLIGAGFWTLSGRETQQVYTSLTPFFSSGFSGLIQAMGFTFIALQGFDLIAAAGGEIQNPSRNIPRAMFFSLGIALAVYLPLLFVVATVGTEPGLSIVTLSQQDSEGVIALAARQFLGPTGFWLVIVAGLLSMLSALNANLFAASRIAAAMAKDRNLPHAIGVLHPRWQTPANAILVTVGIVLVLLLVVPDVAAAGAASSLIFLVTFALAHWIAILARRRSPGAGQLFETPWFPVLPMVGLLSCFSLAVYQGVTVPSAGVIMMLWLGIGGFLFISLFARPARVVDAMSEAADPEMSRLRGNAPLVMVPVANPKHAKSLITMADALTPSHTGRVLALSVAVIPNSWESGQDLPAVKQSQQVLGGVISASLRAGLFIEALTTMARDPWQEIRRIANIRRCSSIVLGLSEIKADSTLSALDELLAKVACDVVILRSTEEWELSQVKEILIPLGGRGWHDILRARILGSLFRTGNRHATLLRILPVNSDPRQHSKAQEAMNRIARDECPGNASIKIIESDNPGQAISDAAKTCDLLILGVQRMNSQQKSFGGVIKEIARNTQCAILMISRKG